MFGDIMAHFFYIPIHGLVAHVIARNIFEGQVSTQVKT